MELTALGCSKCSGERFGDIFSKADLSVIVISASPLCKCKGELILSRSKMIRGGKGWILTATDEPLAKLRWGFFRYLFGSVL